MDENKLEKLLKDILFQLHVLSIQNAMAHMDNVPESFWLLQGMTELRWMNAFTKDKLEKEPDKKTHPLEELLAKILEEDQTE